MFLKGWRVRTSSRSNKIILEFSIFFITLHMKSLIRLALAGLARHLLNFLSRSQLSLILFSKSHGASATADTPKTHPLWRPWTSRISKMAPIKPWPLVSSTAPLPVDWTTFMQENFKSIRTMTSECILKPFLNLSDYSAVRSPQSTPMWSKLLVVDGEN